MKKILFSFLAAVSIYAGEFDYGHGTFYMKGGFYGLDKETSTNIDTFSLKQQHKHIFGTKFFYKYNITWMKSKSLKNTISTVNSYTSQAGIPVNYKIEGIDANLILGRDIFTKDNSFIALGGLLGVTFPYIKSKSEESNSSGSSTNPNMSNTSTQNTTLNTETKISTYKIGVNLNARLYINKYISFYTSANYAYQTGRVKNKDLDLDYHVQGHYQSFDFTMRITPFSTKAKLWIISFSPKLYFTLGYRYDYWQVNKISIDVTGQNLMNYKSDLKMNTSVAYFGLGYGF